MDEPDTRNIFLSVKYSGKMGMRIIHEGVLDMQKYCKFFTEELISSRQASRGTRKCLHCLNFSNG